MNEQLVTLSIFVAILKIVHAKLLPAQPAASEATAHPLHYMHELCVRLQVTKVVLVRAFSYHREVSDRSEKC